MRPYIKIRIELKSFYASIARSDKVTVKRLLENFICPKQQASYLVRGGVKMLKIAYETVDNMKWAYQIFGEGPIEVVIEMGLGTCIGEWYDVAKHLGEKCTVLLYERLGIHLSSRPHMPRNPFQIAEELGGLLQKLHCKKELILVGHSQGGLYVQCFARRFPERIKGLILLDPLSPYDHVFKDVLSDKEYRKSGVDKTSNFRILKVLAKCHLGWLIKKIMSSAPPFYYHDFNKEAKANILEGIARVGFSETALEEYQWAHNEEVILALKSKEDFPNVPLVLITHDSEKAICESMLFGHNTRAFAERVEAIWQQVMKEALKLSDRSFYIAAKESTHYIHLSEPNLIEDALSYIVSK